MSAFTDKDKQALFDRLKPTHSSTELKAGDVCTYTNEFGVSFSGYVISGFDDDEETNYLAKYERIVYVLGKDAWWFPIKVSELALEAPKPHVSDWS